MAMMSTLYNLGSVIMQGSINALGTVYIAAQVGGRRLAELFYVPGLALGTGTATYAKSELRSREEHADHTRHPSCDSALGHLVVVCPCV
ncbi:MAG: hypothetical protein ACLTSZ_15900 [Lachnospiraceae bacterium]